MIILFDDDDNHNSNTNFVDDENDNAEISLLFSMVMVTMPILQTKKLH